MFIKYNCQGDLCNVYVNSIVAVRSFELMLHWSVSSEYIVYYIFIHIIFRRHVKYSLQFKSYAVEAVIITYVLCSFVRLDQE